MVFTGKWQVSFWWLDYGQFMMGPMQDWWNLCAFCFALPWQILPRKEAKSL